MSIATASDLEIAAAPARPLITPLMLAAGCVALADWLFYGWDVGVSLALFLGVLGIVGVAGNRARAPRRVQIAMTAIFIAGLLALIEAVNALSVAVAALATALFVIVVTAREASSWPWRLLEAATIPLRGPFQLVADLFKAVRSMKGRVPHWLGMASLVAWIIPLAACAVFLGLLASANPLIEYRLTQINPNDLLDSSRMVFWLFVVCAIWPLIVRRLPWNGLHNEPGTLLVSKPSDSEPSDPGHLLGVQAMTRSLILFNALFALQSGLDLVYLWGGATLPGGMSHAEYAHRGAYPLIATALLAAGFVLIAMRAGGPAEQSRLIRPLVLAWIGQNILLVISSIFRLDLYVAAFSLTYLRLAAFIWMLLVATGLLLILVQIIRGKSLSWLVAANAVALALVLYGCCFINAPRLVAAYNVSHSREAGGTGPWLDKEYLRSLGPQVLPVLEPRLPQIPSLQSTVSQLRSGPNICESRRRRSENWRAMDFRTWRLQRYLANNPDMATNSPDSGKG